MARDFFQNNVDSIYIHVPMTHILDMNQKNDEILLLLL